MSDREPTPAALSLRSGAALALAALAGGAIAAGAMAWRQAGPSAVELPPAAQADSPVRGGTPAVSSLRPGQALWTQVGAGTSLESFSEVAFADGALLVSDGERASFEPGTAPARPLEVPVPIARVFAAAGRLFAAGENEGAPFLIGLSRGESALVVPVSCPVVGLAGEGESYLAACEGGEAVATSANGARSFYRREVRLPEPPAPEGVRIRRAIDALAANEDGAMALCAVQRWSSTQGGEPLLWTWSHVGIRPAEGGDFRFAAVPGLARAVGLRLAGSQVAVAGLEVDAQGSAGGDLRPRFFAGGLEAPLRPEGEPGPSCGRAADAEKAQGILLGPREAAFLCEGRVVYSFDRGESWQTDEGLEGRVTALRGGDLRLVARAGGKVWLRRFPVRAGSGAVAVRASGVEAPAADGPGPVVPQPAEVREPPADGGLDEAAP